VQTIFLRRAAFFGNFRPNRHSRTQTKQPGEVVLQTLLTLSGLIDRLNRYAAVIAAALVLTSCMISAGNAGMRYLFSMSSNAWLEIQWQMFAGIFLLGAPFVLQKNEHVRVDLLYSTYSDRGKLWLDILGVIFFLLPATLLIAWMGWGFFLSAFESGERSSNAGGLILWPVKLLMPVGFALLALQGLSELIKRIAALQGLHKIDLSYEKPLQ
jgi:TRAP-type mannitol/chloroaromatic compound transport system permease small subunit